MMNPNDRTYDLQTLGLNATQARPLPAAIANFTLRKEIIEHTKFTAAIREVARIHQRGLQAGVAESLLLVGQTGSGKSTLFKFYVGQFPKTTVNGIVKIRVLLIWTPESPTVKEFAEAILIALGDPAAYKGTAAAKTRRIIHFLKECGVELLLIDEFQHFFDGRRVAESRRISDWLKSLINAAGIPVVLAGLPRAIQVVNMNPQLRRRFGSPQYLEPFGFGTESDQREFRGVLKRFQRQLPMGSVDLSEANMARRFYYASHGLFDYVVKVIDDAASRGGTGDGGRLTMADFAVSFKRTVWSAAPDQLNPFMEKATLRLLRQPLEPFDIWDDIAQYTTTAASKARKDPDAQTATSKRGS
jgi:energy-coupling factor transporter ATP-binding protein EcfA2